MAHRVHDVGTPRNNLPARLAFPDTGCVALHRILPADCTKHRGRKGEESREAREGQRSGSRTEEVRVSACRRKERT